MIICRQTYISWLYPSCLLNAKWLKIRLSIPAESKIAKKCLSPPMRVANKLTPEIKSKMAENTPEHPGQSKIAEKMLEPADEGS